ncbi:MAG: hypothetical protein IKU65_04005, partial [Oscillospiraceae bacterium]|nr:hypothetical protein [Oscillospiraceae bacterium]
MAKQATSVIYQDPDGNSREGFIIDGKTYNDAAGTERIAVGSTVPTAGGTYTLTAAGSVKTPGSVADDISRAYAAGQTHLANANTQRQKAINTATQNSLNAINAQRKDVNRRYADTNRNTYNAYVSASNPYGAAEEQRAKLGLSNSGYAESSKLALANTYQSSLAENSRARDQYLNELDTAYREAKS